MKAFSCDQFRRHNRSSTRRRRSPVARDDDGDRISAIRQSHRPGRPRRTDLLGDLTVGPGLAVGNGLQRRPPRRWNSVPTRSSSTSNSVSDPAKYAFNCSITSEGVRTGGCPAGTVRLVGLLGHPEMHQSRPLAGQREQPDRTQRCDSAVAFFDLGTAEQDMPAVRSDHGRTGSALSRRHRRRVRGRPRRGAGRLHPCTDVDPGRFGLTLSHRTATSTPPGTPMRSSPSSRSPSRSPTRSRWSR